MIRFIARQPCAREGGRQRRDPLDCGLGFAHRQMVGLRIKFPHRCADQTRRAAPAWKDKAVRLEGQQCRGHAFARKVNDQNRVVGRHTVKRTRVITDRHVPSLATHASPRGVGVHRAFDLEDR